jgi:predicted nucleic acid-binding protein
VTVLLDSNIVIDVLRGNTAARRFVSMCAEKPCVTSPTITELHAGYRSQREEKVAQDLLDSLRLVRVQEEWIWRRAGEHLKHFGASHGLDPLDALIAATAEHHGLKLATLNVKHFPMIKGLKRAY